jgi:hypothetical protein
MSKWSRLTIVKSIEIDAQNEEFVLTTIQNYKKYETTTRIKFEEFKLKGKVLEPSKLPVDFRNQDCNF